MASSDSDSEENIVIEENSVVVQARASIAASRAKLAARKRGVADTSFNSTEDDDDDDEECMHVLNVPPTPSPPNNLTPPFPGLTLGTATQPSQLSQSQVYNQYYPQYQSPLQLQAQMQASPAPTQNVQQAAAGTSPLLLLGQPTQNVQAAGTPTSTGMLYSNIETPTQMVQATPLYGDHPPVVPVYAPGTEQQQLQMLRQYQVQEGKAFETATLALQEVNKSKKKKKPKKKSKTTETDGATTKNKTKEPKTKAATPLPVELRGMTFEHRSCVQMAAEIQKKRRSKKSESVEEKDAETEQPDQVVQVAKWITIRKGKPNEKQYDLAAFDNSQLRQLAKNFGCKQCGSASMFVCRAEIAKRISMGHLYHTLFIPNSTATKVDLKINTLLRLVNAVCSPEFLDRFLLLNDTKKRKDLEESSGLSPLKVFWMDVSDYFNDAENNDILSVVLDADDNHMADYLKEGTINLNEYNQLNHTVCAKHMRVTFLVACNLNDTMRAFVCFSPPPSPPGGYFLCTLLE